MNENVLHKLKVLAESAKYDVSCSSSGTVRRGKAGMVGNTVGGVGICHSFAEDGRCISLLKVMLTNYCIYDCAYCINRRSNDIPRATLSVTELVELTMEFYRRNYIEGLFLSSGVVRNPDYTMERLVRVAKDLRTVHRFNGYIHLKSIPGASQERSSSGERARRFELPPGGAGLRSSGLRIQPWLPTAAGLRFLSPLWRGALSPALPSAPRLRTASALRRSRRLSSARLSRAVSARLSSRLPSGGRGALCRASES